MFFFLAKKAHEQITESRWSLGWAQHQLMLIAFDAFTGGLHLNFHSDVK
jgi:hypothetical protein